MDYPVRPGQRINADLPPGDRNPGDSDDGRRYVRSDPFSHIVRNVTERRGRWMERRVLVPYAYLRLKDLQIWSHAECDVDKWKGKTESLREDTLSRVNDTRGALNERTVSLTKTRAIHPVQKKVELYECWTSMVSIAKVCSCVRSHASCDSSSSPVVSYHAHDSDNLKT